VRKKSTVYFFKYNKIIIFKIYHAMTELNTAFS